MPPGVREPRVVPIFSPLRTTFRTVNVGVVPTGAVIPQHEQIAFGRISLRAPVDEVRQHLRIAGIGLPQLLHDILLDRATLGDVVAVRGELGTFAVELGDDVDRGIEAAEQLVGYTVTKNDPGAHPSPKPGEA